MSTARKPAAAETATAAARKKPARRALQLVSRDPAAQLAAWCDELGELDKELIEIRPKLRRVETLRALIRERFADRAAAEGIETRGARYLVTLGPRAYESAVDYEAVQKHMGLRDYAAIARPTLKALEEILPPDVLARVVTHDYRGARPVKTFELASTISS